METATTTEARPKRTYTKHQYKSLLQTDLPRPRVASIDEVAEALSMSRSQVRIWILEGKVKAMKMGNRWRIPVSEVERIVRELEGAV